YVVEQCEGIILGAYTWDDGALPDEFKDLYDEMDEIDLTGKKAAAFGSGDSGYDHFCGAVDLLIEKLQERGAEVVMEGLKVEMSPSDEDIEKCKEFGRKFVHQLENPGVI
ncbi:MAG: flavodoxin domain-containing protein, partial [Bacillales bacterium]